MSHQKRVHAPVFRSLAIALVGFVLAVAFINQAAPNKNNQIHSQIVDSKKSTQQTLKTPAKAPPSSATTTPASQSLTPVTPVVVKPKVSVAATVPQPVVTPSPSSNVSGLAPTTTTPPASNPSPTPTATPPTTTGYTSTNWSGYLATTGTFSGIAASWVAPTPIGDPGTTSADSTWIGIGGVSTSDLIQVGTQNIVEPNGQVQTSAFYELLPAASIDIPSLSVNAGDSISASLKETATNQWAVAITDNTSNQTFTINLSYASSNSSAEWIEEDPSYSFRHLIPFDNFQTVDFSNGTAIVKGSSEDIANSNALPVTMISSSDQTEATPSALDSDGSSFTISRST